MPKYHLHVRMHVCLLLVAYKFGWLTNSDIFSAAFWALIMMGSYTPTHTHTRQPLRVFLCTESVGAPVFAGVFGATGHTAKLAVLLATNEQCGLCGGPI